MTTRAPFPYGPSGQDSGGSGGGQGRGDGSGSGGTPPPRPPRSRARTLVPLAVAAWIVLEIWLLILVGEAAGGFTVFLVLVAGLVLGSAVIKRAGRRAWNNLAETVQRAQDQARAGGPSGGTTDEKPGAHGRGGNGTAMLGGLLLMIPGLLTDAAGLLCLFPPTAKLLRGTTERFLERRSGFAPGGLGDTYQQARAAEQQARMHRPDGKVVQGEVVRDDEPPERGGEQGPDAERGRGGEQGR
ncbi:FxsA family membrane protein [Streptomyces reniochalinae]|uniref:FxsA family protein n=1 Tax=Streptomyces reniochalinae TaxID=2250578 RepID=A0A367ESG0_9ACTN|nr:FxsA family membrane protein [Streptomyces reniochalinae]RCG21058.1 FxsA family protein [Streptomyces reniochalinae]